MLTSVKSPKSSSLSKGSFIVLNDRGLHTRPCTELVKCASKFRSRITLVHKKLKVNAKSMLGLLMLCAAKGARIYIEAEGEDANQAVELLCGLAAKKFNVHY